MKLILNLSKKKTGTTFFHDMFKKNEKTLSEVYTPIIKEYYIFPRPTKKYIELGNNLKISDSYSIKDKKFVEKLIHDKFKISIISKMNNSSKKNLIKINNERIKYLLSEINSEYFILSDPNFLDDFKYWSDQDTKNIIKNFSPFYISIIRDPVQSSLSLINMSSKNFNDEEIKNTFKRQYSVIEDLLIFKKFFGNPNILLINFEEFISNTDRVFEQIFNFCKIDLRKINSQNNPNPGTYKASEYEISTKEKLENMYEKCDKSFFKLMQRTKTLII